VCEIIHYRGLRISHVILLPEFLRQWKESCSSYHQLNNMRSRHISRQWRPLRILLVGPAAPKAVGLSCCTYTAGTKSCHLPSIGSVGTHCSSLSIGTSFNIQKTLTRALTAFDNHAMLLHVSLHQIFSIQFLPFHKYHVSLTTVLHLIKLETFPSSTSPHEVKASQ
jgi:hypothetical protein